MDPTVTYFAWLGAVRLGDEEAAREHGEDLAEFLNRGGFFPEPWEKFTRGFEAPSVLRREFGLWCEARGIFLLSDEDLADRWTVPYR